jgi:hypothetical protein
MLRHLNIGIVALALNVLTLVAVTAVVGRVPCARSP